MLTSTDQKIIIYRDLLLPYSETWLKQQAESFKRYTPIYVGTKRIKGLILEPTRTCLVKESDLLPKELSPLSFDPFPPITSLRNTCDNLTQVKLINAHFGYDAINAMFFKKRLSIPLVVTYHGYDACLSDQALMEGYLAQRRYLFWRRDLFEYCDLVLASSNFLRDKLIKQGCPPEKIILHYIGIDLDGFDQVPRLDNRDQSVLFVGRLVEKKGCQDLIDAMRIVQNEIPLARLIVVGDGPLKGKLIDQSNKLNVNCSFLGARSNDEVLTMMKKARVFCVPSVTASNGDSEGLGIVFIEAQASGLPVVSTKHGGIPEAVADGKSGYLCGEKQPKELAERIMQLIRDKEIYRRFQERGISRARRHFDIKKQSLDLEKTFNRLVRQAKIIN